MKTHLLLRLIAVWCMLAVTMPTVCAASSQSTDNSAGAPQKAGAQWCEIYVYDKEFRNGTMSVHLWTRSESDGVTTDTPYIPWGDERERMEFTGKQVTVDGKSYPVYKYIAYTDATHLLFRRDGKDQTKDYQLVNNALYSYTEDTGYSGTTDFNPETDLEPVPDKYKHTVYFQYSWYKNNYWNTWDNMSYYLKAHVWGEGGDLLPWDKNESLREAEEHYDETTNTYNSAYYWNGGTYVNLMEYTFYYFGGEPTNLKFHYDIMQGYYDYDENNDYIYKEKLLSYYTADLDFHEGAVYTYNGQGEVSAIDINPKIEYGLPSITGSFYFIDTDHWVEKEEYDDDYSLQAYRTNNTYDYASGLTIILDKNWKKYTNINGHWYRIYKYDLDQYDEINDDHYIPNKGRLENIMFRYPFIRKRNTGLMPYEEGGVYYYSGNDVTSPVRHIDDLELCDTLPENITNAESMTIYMHLGGNQMMEKELWDPPYCKPIKRNKSKDPYDEPASVYPGADPGFFPDENDNETLKQYSMEKLSDGFYSYTIPAGTDFDDLLFFYYTDEYKEQNVIGDDGYPLRDPETGANITEHVPTGARIVAQLPASRSPYFDPTHLTEYVYDIGVDCFHQSYLTYDEYVETQKKMTSATYPEIPDIASIYLVGNDAVQENADNDPLNAVAIPNDHGCFFIDFQVTEESPATFKLSTIDVASIVKKKITDKGLPEGTYSTQRGWASFNLGLIGCGISRDSFGTDEDAADKYQAWYDDHVVRPVLGQSREIRIKTNETYGFNDYCQYPWRVEVWDADKENGIKADTRYYLVVDLLSDDMSVTLLDFDPHPHAKATVDNVRQATIEDLQIAKKIHDVNNVGLEATAHNNNVYFQNVNIASGKLVFGSDDEVNAYNSLIALEGYNSAYALYLNDNQVLSVNNTDNAEYFIKSKPVSIKIDYMDLPENESLALRGRFTDLSTNKSFRTAYTHGTVDFGKYQAKNPKVSIDNARVCYYLDEKAQYNYTLGTVAAINYDADEDINAPMAYYPDYRIAEFKMDDKLLDDVRVPIVHKDHGYVRLTDWAFWLGIKSETPWKPYNEEEEYSAVNNWSDYIAAEKMLPIIAEDLEDFNGEYFIPHTNSMTVDVKTVYPFLVARDGVHAFPEFNNPAEAAKKVDAAREVISESEPFKFSTFAGVTPVTMYDEREVYTSIESLPEADETDASAEYYNLQGIKVNAANLVPGIYIERKGSQSRKIIVR